MSKTKKKTSFGKILLWIIGIFIALQIMSDGEFAEELFDLFETEDAYYTTQPPQSNVVRRAYLGVSTQDAPEGGGAAVTKVVAGSPAEEAGIQVGDIVVAVGETSVGSAKDLSVAMILQDPWQTQTVVVLRGGEQLTLQVTFGEKFVEINLGTNQTTTPQGGNQSGGNQSGGDQQGGNQSQGGDQQQGGNQSGGSSGDSGSSGGVEAPAVPEVERLPNVPAELQEHVFLGARSHGACDTFEGNVKMLVVFVDDPRYRWTGGEIEQAKNEITATANRMMGDAATYGVSLNLSVEFTTATSSVNLVREEYNNWVDSALTSMGLPTDRNQTCMTLESRYGVSEVPIVFLANQDGRSFASAVSGGTTTREFSIIYDDTAAVYHEVCHIFGAKDFYFPAEVKGLANTYLPESIMVNSGTGTVDSLTAYLIGWTDTLSSEALSFLQSTSYLTVEYLSEQKAIDSYTGYVENRRSDDGSYTGYLVNGVRHGQGTFRWDDGAVYEGNWSHGKRDGYGKMTTASGDVYEGPFVDGKRHGEGTYRWADGAYYTGAWVENQRTGNGVMVYSSGSRYEGQFVNGTPHGTGTYTWTDGARYVGSYVDGQRHGQGKMKYSDGAVYEGNWAGGKRNGQGTMVYANGNRYTGDWVENKRTGQGTFLWASGDKYTGDWVEDQRTGQGTFLWASGGSHTGAFSNGTCHGYGKRVYQDGGIYEGNWVDGKRTGQGTYTWTGGDRYTGEWVENQRTGYGVYAWTDGSRYEGYFLNGKRHGQGTLTYADGRVRSGTWNNGEFVG